MLITFLARGIFSIHDIWKKDQKMVGTKYFLHPKITFNMPVNKVMQFFQNVLYFHLNCSISSNFGKKILKLDMVYPEDMQLYTNLGDSVWFPSYEIALIGRHGNQPHSQQSQKFFWSQTRPRLGIIGDIDWIHRRKLHLLCTKKLAQSRLGGGGKPTDGPGAARAATRRRAAIAGSLACI